MKMCVRIFLKSEMTDIMLKPMDVKATDVFVKERILCLTRANHHDVCIPIENILYYEVWEDKNG